MNAKPFVMTALIGSIALTASAQGNAPAFGSPLQATSYAVGADMIRNFKAQEVQFDLEQLILGLRDANDNAKLRLADSEVRRLVGELETGVRKRMASARKAEGEVNQKKSDAFFKGLTYQPGYVVLPSGLAYRPIQTGTGPKAGDDATVVANYRGSLLDGAEFDASTPGQPATFKLSGLIAGWREAIKLMPAGSKWEIFLPPQLAYGERGAGRSIGPNQALKFDVEVIESR